MAIRSNEIIDPTNTLIDTVLSGYKWDISATNPTISLGVTNGALGLLGDPFPIDAELASAVLGVIAEDLERFLPIDFDPSSPGNSLVYVHPNALFSTADITFSPYDPNGWAPLIYPSIIPRTLGMSEFPNPEFIEFEPGNPGVDVLLNQEILSTLVPGQVGWGVMYHELGHALGLKHPFSEMNGFTNFEGFGLERDPGTFISMMSYEDPAESSSDGYGGSAGYMALDILALQELYGVREDFNTGDNLYDLSSYSASYGDIWYSLYDCGGLDTVSCSLAGESWTVNLSAGLAVTTANAKSGVWLVSNVSSLDGFLNKNETAYENIVGSSYDDNLVGNSQGNILNGGAGSDVMLGGAGNDTYYVDNTKDKVYETTSTSSAKSAGGTDLVYSSVSLNLNAYTGVKFVENLTLTGSSNINATGNSLANKLTGNSKNNKLDGASGNDVLNGGAGSDFLTGGTGSDKVYGGSDKVRDVFDFNAISESKKGSSRDKVYDFRSKIDDLDLKGIDANTKVKGDQAFKFSGTKAAANSVWYASKDVDGSTKTKDIIVYGDVNGDKKADFEIGLVGVTKLVASDFIL